MDIVNQNQKRIGIVAHSIDGGAGRAILRIAEAMSIWGRSRGFSVEIVVMKDPGKNWFSLQSVLLLCADYIRPVGKVALFLTRSINAASRIIGFGQYSFPLVKTRLTNLLEERGYDYLMLGWLGTFTLSRRELLSLKTPYVIRHSDLFFAQEFRHYSDHSQRRTLTGKFGSLLSVRFGKNQKVFGRAVGHIFPSTWLLEKFEQRYPGSRCNSVRIQNPIQTNDWARPLVFEIERSLEIGPEDIVIAFGAPGRFSDSRKGADLFKGALELLDRQLEPGNVWRVHVVTYGGGQLSLPLKNMRLINLGMVGDDLLRQILARSTFFCAPAREDNSPNNVIEAMTIGTPVLGFRNSGFAELIEHEEDGLLAGDQSIEEYASLMFRMCSNPSLAVSMGKAARKKAVKLWSYEKIAAEYLDFFQELGAKA